MKTRTLLLFTLFLIPVLACQATPGVSPTETPVPLGKVILIDEFSNPGSGWNQAETTAGEAGYHDGAYRIYAKQPFTDIWAGPSLRFEHDVQVFVDTLKVGGDRDNRFGLICRMEAPDRFYTFMISSDGYFGIGKVNGSELSLLGVETMQFSDTIEPGTALNNLRADCIGDTLSLYVNGHLLQQVHDAEYRQSEVGLIAGAYGIPGTEIFFDNFVVRKP